MEPHKVAELIVRMGEAYAHKTGIGRSKAIAKAARVIAKQQVRPMVGDGGKIVGFDMDELAKHMPSSEIWEASL